MHSATETMALADYPELVKALSAFYGANLKFDGDCFSV
jgi:aspartyl aminopeptidase